MCLDPEMDLSYVNADYVDPINWKQHISLRNQAAIEDDAQPPGKHTRAKMFNVQISSHYKWNMQVRYRSFSSCRRTFRLQTLTPSAHSTPLLFFHFKVSKFCFLGHFQWRLCRLRSTHLVWRLSFTPFPCQLPRLDVQKLMNLLLRVMKIFFRLPRIGIITCTAPNRPDIRHCPQRQLACPLSS